MCAVIGAVIINPSREDFSFLKKIFLESSIRGLHATGVSYVKNNKIETIKLPVPARAFPFDFENYINEDGNLYLIGHCRYSTSDLEYNQPISNNSVSVVHNGVVTQVPHYQWEELYGYKCTTKNDTEIILRTIEDKKCVLETWKDSSLSVCELNKEKQIRCYRNGKRPLYLSFMRNGVIVTSTGDIASRSGLGEISKETTSEIPMNQYITLEGLQVHFKPVDIEGALDLQQ